MGTDIPSPLRIWQLVIRVKHAALAFHWGPNSKILQKCWPLYHSQYFDH